LPVRLSVTDRLSVPVAVVPRPLPVLCDSSVNLCPFLLQVR
jgi:hypothetical protein